MISPPTVLLALSGADRDRFLSPDALARLRALPITLHEFEPAPHEPASWLSTLATLRPQIILTGWETPPIPPDLAPSLAYVCHLGGSVRTVVPRELIERGVLVTNWGSLIIETVAEAALALILAGLRELQEAGRVLHTERSWPTVALDTRTLFGRRVGIHGFGAVARALIPLLRPFRARLTVHTSGEVPASWYDQHGVARAPDLPTLFSGSEILVEAEALTPATEGTVNAALLDRLPPGALFVNIGRGRLVDEHALAERVASGRLRAALDVYREEPLPAASPLRGLRGAVLTPHSGGPTRDRISDCGDFGVENLRRHLAALPLHATVDLAAYDRST